MFSNSARYYDLLYSLKNYEDEARQIADLIAREHPGAKSILDVACGTGEHARWLSSSFRVDGLDLDPEFTGIARTKVPSGRFWTADMSGFELGLRYDVVQCLFSSIAYLTRPELVVKALTCFARHLNPMGIILVEPWFAPDQWKVGSAHMLTVDRPDLKICRMNTSEREGDISFFDFHYLVAGPSGVEHFTERHDLALYTRDQMLGFFAGSGLEVRYDPVGIFGRGLYIAKSQPQAGA